MSPTGNGQQPLRGLRPFLYGLVMALTAIIIPHVAQGQSIWRSAGEGQWTEATNWSAGVPNGAGSQAVFDAGLPASRATITLPSPVTLGELTIANSQPLTFSGNGPLTFDGVNGVDPSVRMTAINANLTVALPATWALADQLVTDVATNGILTLSQGLSSQTGSLRHQGEGSLYLNGDSPSWNGKLVIDRGTVRVRSATGLGAGGSESNGTDINANGTLLLNGSVTVSAERIRLDGGTLRGAATTEAGPTVQGPLQLLSNSKLQGPTNLAQLNLLGSISGSGGIETRGNILLEGNNTFTGPTNVAGGRLMAGSPNALGSPSLNEVRAGAELALYHDFSNHSFRLHGGELSGHNPSTPGIAGNIELLADSVLGHGLLVTGEVSGSGGLQIAGGGTTLARDNSYTGITRITSGNVIVQAPLALGDPSAPTRIESGGTLELHALVAEPLELHGGTLEIHTRAAAYARPVASYGGEIFSFTGQPLNVPVVLHEGTTVLRHGGNFRGAVTGEGNLTVRGALTVTAPLAHVGDTVFEPGSDGMVVDSANTYTGETRIVASSPWWRNLTARNSQAFGVATSPIHLEYAHLILDAPLQRDLTIDAGALEFTPNGLGYQGQITFLDNPQGHSASLVVDGSLGANIQLDAPETIVRAGTLNGTLSGKGGLTVHTESSSTRVELAGANTYEGLTWITDGHTVVNSPTGLGAPHTGTVVYGGILELNASTNEPLTVTGGELRINRPLSRLPVFGEDRSLPTDVQSRVQLNVPGSFGDALIGGGTLEINANVSVSNMLFRDSGGLQINPGRTLTVLGDLEVRSGQVSIEGRIATNQRLVKTTSGQVDFQQLGNFAGEIHVESGLLYAQSNEALGTAAGRTRVASRDASLVVVNGVTLNEEIELMNSAGTRWHGGLGFTDLSYDGSTAVLQGSLHLGDIGSRIGGGQGGSLEIRGPISGGTLLRTSSDRDNLDALYLTGSNNTFTGELNLQGGMTLLSEAGRLATVSKIVVGRHAGFYLWNTPAATSTDRIGDGVPLTMDGGQLALSSDPTVTMSETIGPLTLRRSASAIKIGASGDIANELTFASLSREERGAAGDFEVGNNQKIRFTNPPTLTNGLVGAWATVTDLGDGNRAGFASYGPDGLRRVANLQTNINAAGPEDNVDWTSEAGLLADRTINSLVVESGQKQLNGHRLTIESGGILGIGSLVGGTITAGSWSGQELIVHGETEIRSTIVDNAHGPVDVTLVGGARLMVPNQHSGTTRLLGRGGPLRMPVPTYLVDGSVPAGTDLVLDNVSLGIMNSTGEHLWQLNDVLITGKSEARFTRLQAQQIELQSGELTGAMHGNGLIRKTTDGFAVLSIDITNFTGQLRVEEGILFPLTDRIPPVSIHPGGTLVLRNSPEPLHAPIELAGGALEFGEAHVRGPITVTASSTIHPTSVNTGSYGLEGDLLGNAPLTIEGNGTILMVHKNNPGFSGPVSIASATVWSSNQGLGTGGITLLPEGRLSATTTDNATGENLPWTTPLVLDGGELRLWSSSGQPSTIAAPMAVKSRSTVGNSHSGDVTVFEGPVELSDQAELLLNGIGTLHFAGPLLIEGTATLDAQVRHSDGNGRSLGTARITGPITANSPNARLDLVAVGVNLEASFKVPEGQSLQILVNGQPAPVSMFTGGQVLEGNGTVVNDVIVAGGAEIQPGASIGRLTVDGAVALGSAGVLEWELADAAPAGVNTRGWDQLRADSLEVTSSASTPFVIRVANLDAEGRPGAPLRFDSARSHGWLIVATDQMTDFEREQFTVDLSRLVLSEPTPADAIWYPTRHADGLHLTYLVPSEIDSLTDSQQRVEFVHGLAGTWFGDSNWNGRFDSSDLVAVFVIGQYEDAVPGNSSWSSGDWNGDRDFTSSDLVLAFQDGGYELGHRTGAQAVPEPTGIGVMMLTMVIVWLRRRW